MLDLPQIVREALWNNSTEINVPFIRELISNIKSNVKGFVDDILLNSDKERVIEQIDILVKSWDLDQALTITYKLYETLLENYYKKYPFQLTDARPEDNEYILRLKKLINRLLIYKSYRLFNQNKKEEAYKIKNNQIDYILNSRYEWYNNDLNRWRKIEEEWNNRLEQEWKNEWIWVWTKEKKQAEFMHEWSTLHFVNWKIQSSDELDKVERLRIDNNADIARYNAMLTLWQYENALDLCLDKLIFFLWQENNTVYNPLLLANSVYIKEWKDLLWSLLKFLNNLDLKNPEEIVEKIYHIIDKPTLDDIRTVLTNLLFELET